MLSDFIQKYNGWYVNFDQVYGPQCMDLYRQYVQEVLEYPQSPGVGVAAEVWETYLQTYYDRIIKTPDNFPGPGDVVIWSRQYGPDGHIAIAVSADALQLVCFSQNDPAGSPAGLKEYSYQNILGWLHAKKEDKEMLKMISLTDAATMIDAKAVKAAGYEAAYLRVRKTVAGSAAGGKDDQKIAAHRVALLAAGMPFGAFMDFDWRPGPYGAGAAQAAEFASQVRADDVLPPGIRLWDIPGAAAITDWYAFTRLLAETVYYLELKVHRMPVIMANLSQIAQLTKQMQSLSDDQKTLMGGVWWDAITWKEAVPVLPSPWTKFPFHEASDHVSSIPGAQGVALMRWPGNMAQLQTWAGNPTMDNLPAWDAVEPPPEEEDPELPPVETKPKTLDDVYAILAKWAEHSGVDLG